MLDLCSGGAGGPHNVPSNVYRGVCKLCGAVEVSAEYWGESAFSSLFWFLSDQGGRGDKERVFKHLEVFHPGVQGGIANFDIQVQSVHKKALTRQKTEAVKIQTSAATNLLNSKAEHRQPALLRVRMVRENDNNIPGPRQGGGGGGGGDEQAGHGERRRRGE